ncbi:MAG: hypothetical protein GX455_10595 [Phycisphaerae bacterium]|nr:hypothetical protein [Phycisphaerae bacterium]
MSRRRRNLLAIAIVLLLVLLGILDRRLGGVLRDGISHWGTDWNDYQRYHNRSFSVVEVIDGDTLDLAVADGANPVTRVRLLGIDTPEKQIGDTAAMYFGSEATMFTTGIALDQEVTVELDTVGDVRDKYHRLLAYIRLPDGTTLNERIVGEGYGYADLRFRHSHFEEYVALQQRAMNSRNGLWAKIRRDQFPPWLQRKRPDLLK